MKNQLNILLAKCKKNDRRAQYQLFDLYVPYVNVIVRRYLFDGSSVQDVVQEVFISVFKSLRTSYDLQKGTFKPWVRKITINRCIQHNKNKKTFEDLNIDDHEVGVEPAVFSRLNEEELLKYLQNMPENYRTVFNLSVIDGYAHKEIANILGITIETSRKKLSRARAWLNNPTRSSKSFINS